MYIGSSVDDFAVREGDTGNLVGTVTLSGVKVYSVAGNYTGGSGHIYVAGASGSNDYLYDVNDTY